MDDLPEIPWALIIAIVALILSIATAIQQAQTLEKLQKNGIIPEPSGVYLSQDLQTVGLSKAVYLPL